MKWFSSLAVPVPESRRALSVDACRMALMYEFVRDLPDGYDKLGKGGALRDSTAADARIRNPGIVRIFLASTCSGSPIVSYR
jgi:hypothetical protein